MKMEIDLPDNLCKSLSRSGKSTLSGLARKHLCDILYEASRLEAARNTSASAPEITGPIIKDSEEYIRRYRIGSRPKWWLVVLRIVSYVSTLLTGGLFDISKFTEVTRLILFLVCLFVATSTTLAVFFTGGKNER